MPPILRPFAPELWVAEGPVVDFAARFYYPTRMAAIRLADGELFIWSPVALRPELKAEIDGLGKVAFLVSPNLLHHLYLAEWKAAYPAARLVAPPGLRRRRRDLIFDDVLGEGSDPPWADRIDYVPFRGSFAMTEVVFFSRVAGTALFADLIQNFRPGWFRGWRGVVARFDGIVSPDYGAPREWRASFLRRRAARDSLRRILDWPIEKVVVAHGDCAEADGKAFVRKAFYWLTP